MGSRDLRKVIGHNISRRRDELGLSQSEVARQLSYTRHWVHRREHGDRSMAFEDLPKLMEVLKVDDPAWFLVDRTESEIS